ncbi:hypothetical protein [Luteibacter sp. 3190]|uniref:hypothetical protein n=1 Tax=Luteibacter sp. 3190 TaxID=2817736 RepID=UPI00285E640B|nr:hypothetical protein [Luteibacter sp. 3190]MDR6935734.1 hypothetical protein [Luteibacter sp. 3190]
MALQITVSGEDSVTFTLDESISEAWVQQRIRRDSAAGRVDLTERLAMCLTASMLQCLDPDLMPPTPAQIIYATDIARELGVSLPFEALRSRGAMSDFIGRYVEVFRARHRSVPHAG